LRKVFTEQKEKPPIVPKVLPTTKREVINMAEDSRIKHSDSEKRSIGEMMGMTDVSPFSSIQPQPQSQPNSSDQGQSSDQNND